MATGNSWLDNNPALVNAMFGALKGAGADIGDRSTVGGDPNNPTAANAAYMADPVMQNKIRVNQGGRS